MNSADDPCKHGCDGNLGVECGVGVDECCISDGFNGCVADADILLLGGLCGREVDAHDEDHDNIDGVGGGRGGGGIVDVATSAFIVGIGALVDGQMVVPLPFHSV